MPTSSRRSAASTVGIFYGKGEVCAAGSRLLVDKSIKNEFIDKLAARTKKMVAGRSDGSEDALRRAVVEEADGDGPALHRIRQEGRGHARRRRRAHRHRHRQGLLRAADGVRGRQAGDDDFTRGDFRPGARRDRVRRHRRGHRARERHPYGLAAGIWTQATSRRPTTSRASSRPARSGSTPTTSTTPRRRSAATSRAASAAK